MKKLLIIIITLAVMVTGGVGWLLYPHHNLLMLPSPLVSSTSTEGKKRLQNAEASADYVLLSKSFQAQALASYCGVASSVSVLNALGIEMNQYDFFTDKASQVRTRLKVVFGGMSLPELAGLLNAHGLKITTNHINEISIAQFRTIVENNLEYDDDFLIVNYQREVLGQGKVGHISPLAAYDRDTDSVLVMDTAAHKYPFTWVPIELLYAGMKTIDTESGKNRGFIEISN